MFLSIVLLYILFLTELHEATSSRKDGSSNSSIWSSWVETSGYEVCDKFHCWRRLSSFYIQYYLSSLLCRDLAVRPRSALCEVSAGAKSNRHPADPLHPKKKAFEPLCRLCGGEGAMPAYGDSKVTHIGTVSTAYCEKTPGLPSREEVDCSVVDCISLFDLLIFIITIY